MEVLFTDWKDKRGFLMQSNVCSITVTVNLYHVLLFLKIMLKPSVEKMETTSMSLERPALHLEVRLSKQQASKDHCTVDSEQQIQHLR